MLRNHLTIALRNLWRNKLHAAINVVGLSIGISACLVIFLIVRHELSFDHFWPGGDRVYRVWSQFSGAFEASNRGVPTAVPGFLREQVTGLERVAAFHTFSAEVTTPGPAGKLTDHGRQADLVIVDSAFFEVFSAFRWLSGAAAEALTAPNQVVLTDRKARQYFSIDDPAKAVGREIRYRDSLVMTVAGIVAAPDRSTDIAFGDFLSMPTVRNSWLKNQIAENNWSNTNSSSQVFVRLAPGVIPAQLEAGLERTSEQYLEHNKEFSWQASFFAQPLRDLHYNPKLGVFDNVGAPAHLPTLYALMAVAVLLLLIAAINFVNLETAQSIRRAKEVGVRKVLGSSRRELMLQFLGETTVLTVISVVLSLQLAEGALHYFADFVPKGVALHYGDPALLVFLAALTGVVSLLAGAYPAFVLSSYRPVLALKDNMLPRGLSRSAALRRGLIVFQFVVAQILIFGTLVIGRQIRFLLDKDMGFEREAIVYFDTPWQADPAKRFVLERELRRLPDVTRLSLHGAPPAEAGYSTNVMQYDKDGELIDINVHRKFGDTAFIHLYGIPLVAGRDLLPADTVRELLVNETLTRRLGFDDPADAVGRTLRFNKRPVPIVGVVRDFHIQSLHNAIEPTAIGIDMANFSTFSLKLNTAHGALDEFRATADKLAAVWKRVYPDKPFEYHFYDQTLATFYESEQRTARLMRTATGVAILISCMGLLGLISYAAAQRTREIGIRKVLGANVLSIVALLTRDFVRLIGIAGLIAFPIAWYGTTRWLSDFAYRIEISWWMFLLAGLAAIGLALITVGFRAVLAARANPVESLKHE